MSLYPINFGKAQFRGGEWHGSADVAYLVPVSAASTIDSQSLEAARAKLSADGFSSVITGALAARETDVLRSDGFVDREHLHLLRYDMTKHVAHRDANSSMIKKGRLADHSAILSLDRTVFDDFWCLDDSSFHEALTATPVSRLRVVKNETLVAYSITGRSGRNGYLQRLAVAAEAQGSGIGSSLVNDSLRWLKSRRVEHVWVNTQESNTRAFELYTRLGFQLESTRLTVLERSLP